MGDRRGAVEAYNKALRQSPRLAAFAAVNRLVPDFADGWLETGRVRQRLGQIDDAVRAFERALALRLGDVAARTALGKIAVERP
jgi:predicted TPR repeat methyltransferase